MKFIFPMAVLGFVVATLPCCGQNHNSRSLLGEAHARQQVQQLALALPKAPFYKPLLPTKTVAVAVVEPMLFAIYGKENIVRQRPYEVYLVDGVWYLSGTLPAEWVGGTFEIMVDAATARVLALTHGK